MKAKSASVLSSKALAAVAAGFIASSLSAGSSFAQMQGHPERQADGQGHEMGSKEMHQSMMSGMDSMRQMQPSGDTDKDFATMMTKHHQQAIEMAKIEAEHGKSPEMKAMAEKIMQDSKKDIERMQKWSKQQR